MFHFRCNKCIEDYVKRAFQRALFTLLAAVSAEVSALGQTNTFEMPTLGARLPAGSFKLVNQLPRSRASKLPKEVPVFRLAAAPLDFATNELQALLDRSVFAGTNIAGLLCGQTNLASLVGPIRLATVNHMDYFFVDPSPHIS